MVCLLEVNLLIAPGASTHPHQDAAIWVIEVCEHEEQTSIHAAVLHCPEVLRRRIW